MQQWDAQNWRSMRLLAHNRLDLTSVQQLQTSLPQMAMAAAALLINAVQQPVDSQSRAQQATCQQDATAAAPAPVDEKISVGLEATLVATSTASFDDVRSQLLKHLASKTLRLREGPLLLAPGEDQFLDQHVCEICIAVDRVPEACIGRCAFMWELDICIRCAACNKEKCRQWVHVSHSTADILRCAYNSCSVFQLAEGPPDEDDTTGEGDSCRFREWQLPSAHFHKVSRQQVASTQHWQASVPGCMRDHTHHACHDLGAMAVHACLQLWENLIFDTEVKHRLLQYSETAITFSDSKV